MAVATKPASRFVSHPHRVVTNQPARIPEPPPMAVVTNQPTRICHGGGDRSTHRI